MRILAPCPEGYPVNLATSFVLMHQSMALEEMGHEVHLFNVRRPPLQLPDYLDAYEFDLILLDCELLRSEDLHHRLQNYRKEQPVRLVAALNSLPPPPERLWEIVDFGITPWKGKTIESLCRSWDVRYLPLGYNARLHRRGTPFPSHGAVFVGNTARERHEEAEEYLGSLRAERVVLCIGPNFERKYLDPYVLGAAYSAARCVPNFHYHWEKDSDWILNERFWQSARCGMPVNDSSPLMAEVWTEPLLKAFCFADRGEWQDRIREYHAGRAEVEAALVEQLDRSLEGHSYHDRMRQLLEWLE